MRVMPFIFPSGRWWALFRIIAAPAGTSRLLRPVSEGAMNGFWPSPRRSEVKLDASVPAAIWGEKPSSELNGMSEGVEPASSGVSNAD